MAPLSRASALHVLEIVGTLMVRAYELGVPALDRGDVVAMRAALDTARRDATRGDLIAALASIHAMHSVVYAATGNPEFERMIGAVGPRFDRVLYLWYTDSIARVGSSYRRDLLVALEAGERHEAVAIMRTAWQRLRDVIAARSDEPA